MNPRDQRRRASGRSARLAFSLAVILLAGCGYAPSASPVGAPPASPKVGAAPSVTPSATVPPLTPVATPAPSTGLVSTPIATAIPVADSSPTPTARTTPASCVALGAYTVVAGDTLWEIAEQYGVTVESLLAANPQITDRWLIRPGDEITIPPRAVDLETPEGYGSFASNINDNGQIVGHVQSASRFSRASLWQDGAMVDLGTLGGAPHDAFDINDAGHVVGMNIRANGASGGFLWRDGAVIDLGTLGGSVATTPVAINGRDQVVGEASTVGGERHAFLWQDGAMTDLGTLDGTRSGASDINDRGQVVGTGSMSGGRPARLPLAGRRDDRPRDARGTLQPSHRHQRPRPDRGLEPRLVG